MAKKDKKAKVELNPPHILYHARLQALFATDPDVEVSEFDTELDQITITVREVNKCLMIGKLIGGIHNFGGLICSVKVVIADRHVEVDAPNPIDQLFHGNKNYERVIRMEGAMSDMDVVIFKPALVQVAEDNAFNPDGGITTYTYEQLAREIFGETLPQVTFTTAAIKPSKK